jgi:glucose/arabinose dehydrogenase
VLAALVISSSLLGPSTLRAADPTPTPTPRPVTTPAKGHEMFGGQPGTTDVGLQAADAPVPLALPAGFHETVVLSGLTYPTSIAFASDGRVFVAEKRGTIKVFDSIDDPTPTTYADLRTDVYDYWDRGLLGLALDPDFASNGNLYALYTYNHVLGDPAPAPKWTSAGNDVCPTPPGPTKDGCVASARLSRLTANPNGIWDGTEHVLIEDWCQVHPSHSIGTVAFGPDGALYAGAGDSAGFNVTDYGEDLSTDPADDVTPDNPCGDPPSPVGTALSPPTAEGGALRAQDLRTTGDPTGLDGSIIRIDPATGLAESDNPLSGDPDPNAARIIAHGLRNPYRFTFRPGTNELWVGDVGWSTIEELNRITVPTEPVNNFGWPCYEGPTAQPQYDTANLTICEDLYTDHTAVSPYYTYTHGADSVAPGDNCPKASGSVTSGVAFYPTGGAPFPAPYSAGGLFFADYARNCIWFMPNGAGGLPDPTAVQAFASGVSGPVELKIGPDGALYYVSFNGGSVRRITVGPKAVATATPSTGLPPLHVQFDGSGSTDPAPGGGPLTYAWDLDADGQFDDSTLPNPTWSYSAGTKTARLKVSDLNGSDIASVVIVADTPPVATISSPASSLTWSTGQAITFAGTATDAEDGAEPAGRLSWTVRINHCPTAGNCHVHVLQTLTGAGGTFTAPDHEYPSSLEIQLVATDALGVASAPVIRTILPKTVNLTFATTLSGISIGVGSVTKLAPFTQTVIVGSGVQVAAPLTVVVGGKLLYFRGWSDGLPPTHAIMAPTTATTYTASYAVHPGRRTGPPRGGR